MARWYERSEIFAVRSAVQEQLELPADEEAEGRPAVAFWAHAEKAA